MKPLEIQVIGSELAIRWDTGQETYVMLEKLRRYCPCAGCMGEKDIMGNLYKGPEKPFSPASFVLQRLDRVGGYALQPVWADGHATGLYTFDYIQTVAASESHSPKE